MTAPIASGRSDLAGWVSHPLVKRRLITAHTQVSQWKKDLLENAGSLFEGKRGPKPVNAQSDPDRLYAKIVQLNMELDWLKKKSGLSL
jgi:hypothetical protein